MNEINSYASPPINMMDLRPDIVVDTSVEPDVDYGVPLFTCKSWIEYYDKKPGDYNFGHLGRYYCVAEKMIDFVAICLLILTCW